ncbi:PfkB family carbohydrate kinase [Enterococcus asini]|uniref:PfkB family carbohydrate kinase n=1 Tax=Enterococcus TaxID=1350 RepID=UPI00288CD4BD|nr:PfkB family carbohydrate kinase [Enterococcus asini]MDT2757165.1 PfkB family carbohydrate kinase [Enterococcus asini]
MSQYVVGFGDNVVDYYVNFNRKYPGGNAVNFAVNAQKSGVKAYYVGSLSSDSDGVLLQHAIESEQVDISYCEIIETQTEQAHVKIKDGDREFIGGIPGQRKTPDLTQERITLFQNSALVHTSCHSRTEDKLKELKKYNVSISFDFSDVAKYRTEEYLADVCPSLYMAQFSVANDDEREIHRLIGTCQSFEVPYILLTRGSKSPIFVDTVNNKTYQGFIKKVEAPHDTMGAGDAYFAAFASHFVLERNGKTMEEHVIDCFHQGADVAYKTLSVDGSFGHGEPINP